MNETITEPPVPDKPNKIYSPSNDLLYTIYGISEHMVNMYIVRLLIAIGNMKDICVHLYLHLVIATLEIYC